MTDSELFECESDGALAFESTAHKKMRPHDLLNRKLCEQLSLVRR